MKKSTATTSILWVQKAELIYIERCNIVGGKILPDKPVEQIAMTSKLGIMVIKRNICGFYWHTEAWWKCCKPVWLMIATTELDWYMYFTKLSWCAASISHYPFKFCSLEYNHFRGKSKIIFVRQLHHRYPPIFLLFNLVSGLMNCRMIQKYM